MEPAALQIPTKGFGQFEGGMRNLISVLKLLLIALFFIVVGIALVEQLMPKLKIGVVSNTLKTLALFGIKGTLLTVLAITPGIVYVIKAVKKL